MRWNGPGRIVGRVWPRHSGGGRPLNSIVRRHEISTVAKLRVPGASEWAGYKDDLDVKYAHKLFFGRTYFDVVEHFGGGRSIERADELQFMPRKAFQYYVMAFVEYLRSDVAAGDSDSASPFLRLLIAREKRDPGSVAEIYDRLSDTVDFVASSQPWFEADPNIYGDFGQLAEEIRAAVKGGGS